MKKILPDPADYMEDVLDAVKYNITTDKVNLIRELTNKILGFQFGSFGRIEISESKVNYFRNKIDPEILKNSEDKLIKSIEENLDKMITKTLINELTRQVIDRVYDDVAEKIFTIISEKISSQVEAKIDESLKTWMVAAQFVDGAK